jgi:hypothetical protein
MKKPSNTSTQGGIVSHSRRSQMASDDYHNRVITPVVVRPARMKMTRSEHQLNNPEDMSEKGHRL